MVVKFKPEIGSGDRGTTSLLSGKRVKKTDPRIAALALVDDLTCHLGLVKEFFRARRRKRLADEINAIQNNLLLVSGAVAGGEMGAVIKAETEKLEKEIKSIALKAGPLKEFIIPGKTRAEAFLHCARSKTRICEIAAWKAGAGRTAVYLNRLSDFFFLSAVLAGRDKAQVARHK